MRTLLFGLHNWNLILVPSSPEVYMGGTVVLKLIINELSKGIKKWQ